MNSRWQSVCMVAVLVALSMGCGGSTTLVPVTEPFPQPPEIRSAGGVLRTTLTCEIGTNTLGSQIVNTPTYNGSLVGPTLRIRPGDTLDIDIVNALPPNPAQARMGAFPHEQYTTNLHTHGMTVNPNDEGDNVFRRMPPRVADADPAPSYPFTVTLPDYHPTGTMWYHPHKHGAVSYQFFGGMSGFLIVEGGPGSFDALPAVRNAKEVLMAFQGIRVDSKGEVPWVNVEATDFKTLWNTYAGTALYPTTNGAVNPTLRMRPGEVQRWRWLNAFSGETLALTLEGHDMTLVAQDGLTLPTTLTLTPDEQPYIMGAGNRADVMIRAGRPGTYRLLALDPATVNSSISPQGIEPGARLARVGGEIPSPAYPIILATIHVSGAPVAMALPQGPLPVPPDLDAEGLVNATPDVTRRVAFQICGGGPGNFENNVPACIPYYGPPAMSPPPPPTIPPVNAPAPYDASYWGGTEFKNLLMMRDADDVTFEKQALFTGGMPLFDDMVGGNIEEWTVLNQSFSDHPFHIHVNPILLTHINGVPLPVPEWRDTVLVPAAVPTSGGDINDSVPGSVTFRTHFDPNYPGSFVMHCHILTHEDVGMMQELEVK